MPHTKKFMMNLSFCRIMVLSGCLLLNAIGLFAQQPDTAKPKRNVLNNILTRVITGNKDTVKPNTNPANNPNNNNPNKPVKNRDAQIPSLPLCAQLPLGFCGSRRLVQTRMCRSNGIMDGAP